jgi:hypothetical protein
VSTSPVGETEEFQRVSKLERGRVLTGRFAHYCLDWDFLTVDETCVEAESCHDCDYDDEARAEIARAVAAFEANDPGRP